jgi:tRNA-guanine family transglycosylase
MKYWEWFDIDGIIVSLSSLHSRSLQHSMEMGIHRFCGFNGTIIIDSGGLSLIRRPRTQTETFQFQRWLGADFAVHLDRPYVKGPRLGNPGDMLKETLQNARIAKALQSEYGDMEVIYVVQGWDLDSYSYCARKLNELNVEYYGVGSLIGKSTDDIVNIVTRVRNIIGNKARLHIFGISKFETISLIRDQIDSFDSSAPIKASFSKEYITSVFDRLNVNSSPALVQCDCPVCKKCPGSIAMIGLKGRYRRHNMLRAAHNAYVITRFARHMEE